MSESIRRLPEAEQEVMLAVWKANSPVSSSAILEELKGKRCWKQATLMTVLSRLAAKGFLRCEKQGRNNLYHAVIQEKQYKESESKSVLEKLYDNSLQNLVTSLYEGNTIDNDDIAELRQYLDQIEKEEKRH